jgi:hypothetical protein
MSAVVRAVGILHAGLTEGVFDASFPKVLYFGFYDRIVCRKNNGGVETYITYEAGDALEMVTLHAEGHFNVERPGQHHHVLKGVIGEIRHGTHADLEFRGRFQRLFAGYDDVFDAESGITSRYVHLPPLLSVQLDIYPVQLDIYPVQLDIYPVQLDVPAPRFCDTLCIARRSFVK